MDEIRKYGKFWGPTPRLRDPTQQRKSTPRCGMSTLRHGREGVFSLRLGEGLRRGVAIAHNMEILCFCFVLFFRCFKDLSIGLMRTL